MSAAPSVHDLLLALAGRLDDDLLAWARELLAVGEQDQAVELVTAALVAERVALPAPVRAGLAAAAQAAHTDLDVDRALPTAVADGATPHRFAAGAGPRDGVVAALRGVPARRLTGCTLRLTWRRTPAGATPGPLPHAVVLVEADPDRSPDVLAYLLATELERAGAPASVEVFTTGTALPAYHAAALREADEVLSGSDAPRPTRHGADGSDLVAHAEPDDAPPPAAGPDPVTHDEPGAATLRQPAVGRRRRPDPVDDVAPAPAAVPPQPSGPATDPLNGPLREPLLASMLEPTGPGGPDDAAAVVPDVSRADDTPAGPEVPEPRDVPEKWAEDWRSGEWAMPRTAAPPPPAVRPGPADAFDVFGTAGPAPDDELPRRDEQAGDLPRRGELTGQGEQTGQNEQTGRFPGAGRQDPVPFTGRRPEPPPAAPREVSLFESPTARVEQHGPAAPGPRQRDGRPAPDDLGPRRPGPAAFGPPPSTPDHLRAVPPLRESGPESTATGAGMPAHQPGMPPGRRRRPEDEAAPPVPAGPPKPDPEPSALLNGTERDLLAQLQAELADRERRPRPYRRAAQNGRSHSVNGHGSGDDRPPPDLAG